MKDHATKPLRDDRSIGDIQSVDSNDDLTDSGSDDRFMKQKRRGSGLGGIANFFKANNAKKNDNDDGVLGQVKPDGLSDDLNNSKNLGSSTSPSERSPQEFFDIMLRTRGYSRELYSTLDTAYFNKPTPLQEASYHNRIKELARKNDISQIRSILAAGISNNPSNEKGQSLMHHVCRLGYHEVLALLINEFQADVKTSDDSGKTPLHEACEGAGGTSADGPLFAVIDLLATQDRRMFSLKDCHGKTPLDYTPMEHWTAWIDFLYVRRDMYWPRRLVRVEGEEPAPPLTEQQPHSRPLPDPPGALSIDLATALVAGDMTPEQVAAAANN